MSGLPDIRLSGCLSTRLSGYPATRISGHPDIRISKQPDFRTPRYPDFRPTGYLHIRLLGHPTFRRSGCRDIFFFACFRCRLKSNRMWIYVALSRPPSLAQLISIGLPEELRSIIEGGPPEGILSRFCDMFKEKEDATHIRAAEVMRELGWDAID